MANKHKPLKHCVFCKGTGTDMQQSRKVVDWIECRCVGACPTCGTRSAWGLTCPECIDFSYRLPKYIQWLKDHGYVVYRKGDAQ